MGEHNIESLCPKGQRLLEQKLIPLFQKHLIQCWTCGQAFYAPKPLPIPTDDLCPNAIVLQTVYLLSLSSFHRQQYEYHLQECCHCKNALSESRFIGEIIEHLQSENLLVQGGTSQ